MAGRHGAGRWAVAALLVGAAALLVAVRRRSTTDGDVELPEDALPHDGMASTQSQAVLLLGGPMDGAWASAPWGASSLTVRDEDRVEHVYVPGGRTAEAADGRPCRVFVHQVG